MWLQCLAGVCSGGGEDPHAPQGTKNSNQTSQVSRQQHWALEIVACQRQLKLPRLAAISNAPQSLPAGNIVPK
jgi:hypothetical protein